MTDAIIGDQIGHLTSVNDFKNHDFMRKVLQSCGKDLWMLDTLDPNTSHPQDYEEEMKRLEVLRSYSVLDTDTDSSFERITGLASRIFGVPICLVSIVDLGRQWFASNRGLGETKETKRNVAFCAHAILSSLDMLLVNDATKDARFANNPLVTGGPKIRFYAGVPLVTPEGYKLGTLCIIDDKPWPQGVSLHQKQNLLDLSQMVMDTIVKRKKDRDTMERSRERLIASTAHEMITPLTSIQLNLGMLHDDACLKEKMSKRNKEQLQATMECVGHLTNICNQTIDSFRSSDTSNVSLRLQNDQVNVAEMLKKLEHFVTPYCNKVKVPVEFHISDKVPPLILSDGIRLLRSMITMVTETLETTESGSITVRISIQQVDKKSESKDVLMFECTSTGKDTYNGEKLGLAPNHVRSLGGEFGFKPRVMINGEDKKDSSNCREEETKVKWFTIPIILPAKSKPNELDGTVAPSTKVFMNKTNLKKRDNVDRVQNGRQFLKKARVDEETSSTASLAESDSESHTNFIIRQNAARKKCALIIDDTKVIRKVFERALTGLGFEVKQAENGLKGLLQMKATMFDVVFCDFLMPLLDGLDCVQQYRAWERENRSWFKQYIVGISAHANSDDAQRGLNVGMNQFMPKPIKLNQLKELISSEAITNTTEKLNKLASKGEARPFLLYNDDLGTKLLNSASDTSCTSDVELSQRHLTCLVAVSSSDIITTVSRCVERHGWRVRIVKDGVSALSLMKIRNWDAIFIDDNLPQLSGHTCISVFKDWEAENRIARQRNIHIISSVFNDENKRVPPGFDGALGTHFTHDDVVSVLNAGMVQQKKPSIL